MIDTKLMIDTQPFMHSRGPMHLKILAMIVRLQAILEEIGPYGMFLSFSSGLKWVKQ